MVDRAGSADIAARDVAASFERNAAHTVLGMLSPAATIYRSIQVYDSALRGSARRLSGGSQRSYHPISPGRISDLWHGVRAFHVTSLSVDSYEQEPTGEDPMLMGTGVGWNADGMHVDPHRLSDGRWIACVDGMGERSIVSSRRSAGSGTT
jgi:hypothetical protein